MKPGQLVVRKFKPKECKKCGKTFEPAHTRQVYCNKFKPPKY